MKMKIIFVFIFRYWLPKTNRFLEWKFRGLYF